MGKVVISDLAYIKAFLHGARNPTQSIGGFLLGKDDLEISNVIPVYHGTPLGPSLDNALLIINAILKNSSSSEKVIGFYYATATLESDSSSQTTNTPVYIEQIADSLKNELVGCNNSLMLQFVNKDMNKNDILCLKAKLNNSTTNIELKSKKNLTIIDLNKKINSLLENNIHRKIYDIDDYLDNTKLDFRNEFLADMI